MAFAFIALSHANSQGHKLSPNVCPYLKPANVTKLRRSDDDSVILMEFTATNLPNRKNPPSENLPYGPLVFLVEMQLRKEFAMIAECGKVRSCIGRPLLSKLVTNLRVGIDLLNYAFEGLEHVVVPGKKMCILQDFSTSGTLKSKSVFELYVGVDPNPMTISPSIEGSSNVDLPQIAQDDILKGVVIDKTAREQYLVKGREIFRTKFELNPNTKRRWNCIVLPKDIPVGSQIITAIYPSFGKLGQQIPSLEGIKAISTEQITKMPDVGVASALVIADFRAPETFSHVVKETKTSFESNEVGLALNAQLLSTIFAMEETKRISVYEFDEKCANNGAQGIFCACNTLIV